METNISGAIDITTYQARYDQSIKELLADKQILARILKYSLEEFSEMEMDAIISGIGTPEVSKVYVAPGHTNTEKAHLTGTEDEVYGEGKIRFDIRFSAYSGKGQIKILINVEAQKSTDAAKLGYHLDNRILFYLSRMISAQKGTEFLHSNYDDIKPVRSIWICMDTEEDKDSINRIRFRQESMFGPDAELPDLDKVQGVIIRIRECENVGESKNTLIAMLEELLRKEPAEVKKLRLSGKYGIQMTTDTKERVNTMCNLSEVILEKGIEQGIEKKMLEVIRNMIRHDYSDEQIMEVVDVPKDKVKLIREEMQQPV